jgi:hypothetical protein
MSSITASGLFGESTMPSRRDISVSTLPSSLVGYAHGDRLARDALLVTADCNPPIGSRHAHEHPWGLRGSSDVICGIRATTARVRPQPKPGSSTVHRSHKS